jgi:DinB superfamily
VTSELAAIIDAVEPLLQSRSIEWWNEPWAPGKWQRRQVLGHLIDSASNNHQRFVRALIQDSYEGPGYDQEGCIRVEHFDQAPVAVLTSLFCSYNRLLVHVTANFPPGKLVTICRVGSYPETTLGELAIDYLAHLEHHLRQMFGDEPLAYSGLRWPRGEV